MDSAVAFTSAGDLFESNLGFDNRSGSDDFLFGFAHPFSNQSSAGSSISTSGYAAWGLGFDAARTL